MSSFTSSSSNNSEVKERIHFPSPRLSRLTVRRIPVIVNTDGTASERTVLVSSSNLAFELGRKLKESIYGQVNHGFLLTLGDNGSFTRPNPIVQIAIKFYSRGKLRAIHGKTQENPLDEIAAMQYLNSHPNIMTAIDCCSDAQENIYTIMDFCDGGELFDVIADSGALPESRSREIFRQILHGVAHIHNAGVGHRDLSLENVLVSTSTGVCKIIDFGMSILVPVPNESETQSGVSFVVPPQGVCGKKNYISPEVLENRLPFNPLCSDVWALGVVLFILLTGVPPVDAPVMADPRFRMIASNLLPEMLEQWGVDISVEAVDLLVRMLRPDPHMRLTVAEILKHPWVAVLGASEAQGATMMEIESGS